MYFKEDVTFDRDPISNDDKAKVAFAIYVILSAVTDYIFYTLAII